VGLAAIHAVFSHFDALRSGRWRLAEWDLFQVALGEPAFSADGNDLAALEAMLRCDPTSVGALVAYYALGAGQLGDDLTKLGLLAADGLSLTPHAAAAAASSAAATTASKSAVAGLASSFGTADAFEVGAKVEARYRGGPEFFSGTVTSIRSDGGVGRSSFDVTYDDGDQEANVKALRVRRKGAKQKKELGVGAVVEARFGAGKAFFDAEVTAAHGDDTYDLRYADGDVEKKVARNLISAEWQ
jgi:hypothetical protein